jgi:hypothetical protein
MMNILLEADPQSFPLEPLTPMPLSVSLPSLVPVDLPGWTVAVGLIDQLPVFFSAQLLRQFESVDREAVRFQLEFT